MPLRSIVPLGNTAKATDEDIYGYCRCCLGHLSPQTTVACDTPRDATGWARGRRYVNSPGSWVRSLQGTVGPASGPRRPIHTVARTRSTGRFRTRLISLPLQAFLGKARQGGRISPLEQMRRVRQPDRDGRHDEIPGCSIRPGRISQPATLAAPREALPPPLKGPSIDFSHAVLSAPMDLCRTGKSSQLEAQLGFA